MKNLRYIDEKIHTSDDGESVAYVILLDVKKRIFYYILLDGRNGWHFYKSNFLNDLEVIKGKQNNPQFVNDEILRTALEELINHLKELVT